MLTEKEQERVAELHREIWEEEHSGKTGFSIKLVRLTQEMQGLYGKQEVRLSPLFRKMLRLARRLKVQGWNRYERKKALNWYSLGWMEAKNG